MRADTEKAAKEENERRLAMRFKVVNPHTGAVYAGLENLTCEHSIFLQNSPTSPWAEMRVGQSAPLSGGDGLVLVRTELPVDKPKSRPTKPPHSSCKQVTGNRYGRFCAKPTSWTRQPC